MGINKITISALGPLRKNIPEETEIELLEEITAFELVEKNFGIPKTESRMSFVINGRMERGTYVIKPGDTIKVLKMGGAG